MTAKPKVGESPRELIARVLFEEVTDERIRQLILSAFELMQGTYVADGTCSGCGKAKKVHVRVPDLKGTVTVLTEWVEQGFGRPGTASTEGGDVVLIVERPPIAEEVTPLPHAGNPDLTNLQPASAAAGVS